MNKSVTSKNKLYLKYPATWWNNMWREALPSGNGVIGASVYGGVQEETILLNHHELWYGGRKDPLPDVSCTLTETRELMLQGKYMDADWHLTNALKASGYATELASKLPLADLRLTMPCSQAFRKYLRSVNMETGEVHVCWEDGEVSYERKLFVSRTDDVIVYEINSSGESINGEISLVQHRTDKTTNLDKYHELAKTVEVKLEGDYMYYAAANDDGSDFGVVLRIVASQGELIAENQAIQFTGASQIRVLAKLFINKDRETEWARLHEELALMDQSYEQLLAAHSVEHQRLFFSATLNLFGEHDSYSNEELLLQAYDGEAPTSLMEKMWAYGRYLFISGTAAEGSPFGMYGLWPGDYGLDWCLNMANENVQMIYWHATVGGLSELMPALIHYYDGMMDDFRDNARKLYGCRGIYIPAGSTPGIGVPNQIVPVIMNWTGAAAWLSRHYYDYYLFTGDKLFLVEKVLPFMREVALFYEDFLVIEDNGLIRIYPSVSPENSPQNFVGGGGDPLSHPMPTTINATMDIALLKEVLTHLIRGSQEASVYTDEIVKWADLLKRIPDYQVNGDGAVREWMHPNFDDNYNHRHLSHIYPIFPGQEFTRELAPDLFGAFETAVNKRLIDAQSGWSLTHMAAIYARLGNGSKAVDCLNILSRSCLLNNFFTVHNDWRNMGVCINYLEAPIQLDASMGWVNAVQEMLLYVSPALVKLLPAIPDKWEKGEYQGLCFTTGTISVSWDKKSGQFNATLTAIRDTDITIKLPEWLDGCEATGVSALFEPSPLGNGCYRLEMKSGEVLRITNKEI